MSEIIGVGSLTIADLNDAIISSTQPERPTEGLLWIDDSNGKGILKVYKNGSWVPRELDVNQLDPDLAETVQNIINTLGTIANDGELDLSERTSVVRELSEIIGEIPSKAIGNVYPVSLPSYENLDSNGVGTFASVRSTARDVGMSDSDSVYLELRQAYTNLNSFLSQFSIKPWDVTTVNKDQVTIIPDPDEFRQSFLDYYMAELRLSTEAEKQAQEAMKDYTDLAVSDVITKVDVEYAKNTSQTTAPTSGWNTTPPAWEDGSYIWSRTITNFKNGDTDITTPVNITGAKGATGDSTDGRSITNIKEQYYLSDSSTELLGDTWGDTPPAWQDGKYMWTRSIITFANPYGTQTTDPISVTGSRGEKGEPGQDGVSVTSTDVQYYLSTSQTSLTSGTGWETTPPTWKDGWYMWTKTVTTYSNGTKKETKPVNVTGSKGAVGDNGRSVSKLEEQYALGSSKTSSPSSFSTTRPDWQPNHYMWTRIKITYDDGGVDYTPAVVDASWEAIEDSINNVVTTFDAKIENTGDQILATVSELNTTQDGELKKYTDSKVLQTAEEFSVELSKITPSEVNLLKDSKPNITGSGYPIASFALINPPAEGEEVTVVIKGELNRDSWALYNSGGGTKIEFMYKDSDLIAPGIWKKTFSWVVGASNNTYLRVYPYPNDSQVNTLEWIKLVRGNKTSNDWSPSSEDMVSKDNIIASFNLSEEEAKLRSDKIVLDGDTEVRGDFTVSGGNISAGTITAANNTNENYTNIDLNNGVFETYGTQIIREQVVSYDPGAPDYTEKEFPSLLKIDGGSVTVSTGADTNNTFGAGGLAMHDEGDFWDGSVTIYSQIPGIPGISMSSIDRADPNDPWNGRVHLSSRGSLTLEGIVAGVSINGDDIVASGSNSNGDYVRFYDGTQICWTYITVERSSSFELKHQWTFPVGFANGDYRISGMRGNGASAEYRGYGLNFELKTGNSVMIFLSLPTGTTSSGWNTQVDLTAIGRWK